MYHGIVIDQEFENPEFVHNLKIINSKQDGTWLIYGIEVDESELNEKIELIQRNLKDDSPWYVHLYNEDQLIVIFKRRIFVVDPHVSTWWPIIEYGKEINIPIEQLDFWPNRFQDEKHYFGK